MSETYGIVFEKDRRGVLWFARPGEAWRQTENIILSLLLDHNRQTSKDCLAKELVHSSEYNSVTRYGATCNLEKSQQIARTHRKSLDLPTYESEKFDWHPHGSSQISLLARHLVLAHCSGARSFGRAFELGCDHVRTRSRSRNER